MNALEKPLVLKWGSTSTTNESGIDEIRVDTYAGQIAEARNVFPNIIAVASGSVAVGKAIWHSMHGEKPFPSDQSLAMLGTASAHDMWQKALNRYGILAGQMLATHHQVDDRSASSILDATLKDNFENGLVPVVNENDALSIEEMARFSYGGENDGLASHFAVRFGAAAMILYTDTEGLMHNQDRSRLVSRVAFDDASATFARVQAGWIEGVDNGFENSMLTKVDACLKTREHGIRSFIAQAGTPILDVLEERAPSTYFEEFVVAA